MLPATSRKPFMIAPKRSVLASVGAETFVAAGGGAAKEPAATVGHGAADGMNETGYFGGEALPECGAEVYRTVPETLPGNLEVKRHAGEVLGDCAVEAFAGRCGFLTASRRIPQLHVSP